jgi:hypothetical protein
MSEVKKPQPAGPAPVSNMPDKCPVEACGKGAKKLAFCEEHFMWFKQGLVNKKGEKPSDFDKKFQSWKRKHAA